VAADHKEDDSEKETRAHSVRSAHAKTFTKRVTEDFVMFYIILKGQYEQMVGSILKVAVRKTAYLLISKRTKLTKKYF
jgi:hypothetical protein